MDKKNHRLIFQKVNSLQMEWLKRTHTIIFDQNLKETHLVSQSRVIFSPLYFKRNTKICIKKPNEYCEDQ